MAKPFCMVCCAKAAKGEISHHEIRKAKVQFRMYQSGETAYLCNQCSKDNFEIDPATKIGRSKRDVGLARCIYDGGYDRLQKPWR